MQNSIDVEYFSKSKCALNIVDDINMNLSFLQRGILLCACFIVAWTPYAIFSFITSFFDVTISAQLTTLPSMFAKSCTIYNPIIYFFTVKTYREEAKQYLGKLLKSLTRMRLTEETTSRKHQKTYI